MTPKCIPAALKNKFKKKDNMGGKEKGWGKKSKIYNYMQTTIYATYLWLKVLLYNQKQNF